MNIMVNIFVICLCYFVFHEIHAINSFRYKNLWHREDQCAVEPRGRVPWILHRRNVDKGWGGQTYWAVIALAVNRYGHTDRRNWPRMVLELEMEITRALLRYPMADIRDNDLALFIHALVASNKNPRDFYGIDLVADLQGRVNGCILRSPCKVHPYLVLALCNSRSVDYDHLYHTREAVRERESENRQQIDMEALSLKAFACAADFDKSLFKFKAEMKTIVQYLRNKQNNDGSFGNVYTTSLVVQALTAFDDKKDWKEREVLNYLQEEAVLDVNMIKAYYIEMALNARKVKFIKDLNNLILTSPYTDSGDADKHYVTYVVKKDEHPAIYSAMTIKVPKSFNFYEIMQMCAEKNDKYFNFEHYLNINGDPVVYSVAGIQNDVEEDRYWRLCEQKDMEHLSPTSRVSEINYSPKQLIPQEKSLITLWYRSSGCPATAGWFP